MVLDSPFPQILLAGPQFIVCTYNDAYRPLLVDKSEALGRPFLEVWSEAEDSVSAPLQAALAGESFSMKNAPFTLLRRGALEHAFFNFAFSPVRGASGDVVAVLATGIETTSAVRAENGWGTARSACVLR